MNPGSRPRYSRFRLYGYRTRINRGVVDATTPTGGVELKTIFVEAKMVLRSEPGAPLHTLSL